MKKFGTTTRLLSTALAVWLASQNTLAMQQEPTHHNPPPEALTSPNAFLHWLDTLKDGHNDATIEGAKQAFNTESRAFRFKLKTSLEYLNTSKTSTKEHTEELAKARKELTEVKEQAKTAEQEKEQAVKEKDFQQKVFQQTSGFTAEEVARLILNIERSLSNFSDGLFLMKFSGDKTPEFSKTLGTIISQAEAAKKVKDDFTKDTNIQKLEVYLQLPQGQVDTKPLAEKFHTSLPGLYSYIEELTQKLRKSVDYVKKLYEEIDQEQGFSSLDALTKKEFLEFRKGASYVNIYDTANKQLEFFEKLLFLLKEPFTSPLDFKVKFDEFKEQNSSLLSDVMVRFIGTPGMDDKQGYLISKSCLTFYKYLGLMSDTPRLPRTLLTYTQNLMKFIDLMRAEAFDLMYELDESLKFTASGDNTHIPLPKGAFTAFLTTVNAYVVAEEENALLRNLNRFIKPTRDKWVDYESFKNYKVETDNKTAELMEERDKLVEHLKGLSESRQAFCLAKNSKVLTDIILSDLFTKQTQKKDELVKAVSEAPVSKKKGAQTTLDTFLANHARDLFKPLLLKNNELKQALQLLEEKASIREPREQRNEKAAEFNRNPLLKEEQKKKIEEEPPLTLENMELTGIIQHYISTNNAPSFDNFWKEQEQTVGENLPALPIPAFLSKLSDQQTKNQLALICKNVFIWIQQDTPERKALNLLIAKVITAHDNHIAFMKRMETVKTTFEALEGDIPHYTIDQMSIEAKVNQLRSLVGRKPGIYLSLAPEDRATFYTYNFQMFASPQLKPLKPEMEIWGQANGTQKLKNLHNALTFAYKAYILARDSIIDINPAAKDRGNESKMYGGFDEELGLG